MSVAVLEWCGKYETNMYLKLWLLQVVSVSVMDTSHLPEKHPSIHESAILSLLFWRECSAGLSALGQMEKSWRLCGPSMGVMESTHKPAEIPRFPGNFAGKPFWDNLWKGRPFQRYGAHTTPYHDRMIPDIVRCKKYTGQKTWITYDTWIHAYLYVMICSHICSILARQWLLSGHHQDSVWTTAAVQGFSKPTGPTYCCNTSGDREAPRRSKEAPRSSIWGFPSMGVPQTRWMVYSGTSHENRWFRESMG